MYLLINLNKSVPAGEPIVIRSDYFGGIGAFIMSGEKVGELSGAQPEGCAQYHEIAGYLYDNRIFGKIAIKAGNAAFLYTDSVCLERPIKRTRVVKEGYGMLVTASR